MFCLVSIGLYSQSTERQKAKSGSPLQMAYPRNKLGGLKIPAKIESNLAFRNNAFHFVNKCKEVLPIQITHRQNRKHHANILRVSD